MATTNITSGPVKNNSGTIVNIGNHNPKFISRTTADSDPSDGPIGSVVVEGLSTEKSLLAGEFAYNSSEPVNMIFTYELAGVSGVMVKGNVLDSSRVRQFNQLLVATAIREAQYNYYNNTFASGYPQTSTYDLCPNDLTGISAIVGGRVVRLTIPGETQSTCDQFNFGDLLVDEYGAVLVDNQGTGILI